jgi:ribosomal protein S27AE
MTQTPTYEVKSYCPNCANFIDVRIPRKTLVQGFRTECPTCGVTIRLKERGAAHKDDRWYDFLRDFFFLGARR